MATIDTSGADAVRVVSDERLDIPDFDAATFGLNSEQLSRVLGMWGGLVEGTGYYQGCVSKPSTSYDTGTKFLTINGFALYQSGSAASPSASGAGRVIAYDPTQQWQMALTGVDLSAFSPSTSCVVWALPGTTTSTLETRKRWLPGASGETSFSTQSRTRTIISDFQALPATFTAGRVTSFTAPPSDEWVAVLKIESWSGSAPVVGVIGAWDGTADLSIVGNVPTELSSNQPTSSLTSLIYKIRRGIAYLRDNTGSTNWLSDVTTYRGVKQLDTDLTTAEADIVATDNLIAALCSHITVASFTIYYTGGAWTLLLPSSNTNAQLSAWSRLSAGYFTFQIRPGVMAATSGYVDSLTGVQVTIRSGTTGAGAIIYNTSLVTDAAAGTFTIQFLDSSGTAADPPNNGFSVAVTGRKA